jgi:hypothetical protein
MACEMTEWRDWKSLDALAAAHAELGDFSAAIHRCRQAIKACLTKNEKLEAHLASYEAQKPFREKPH